MDYNSEILTVSTESNSSDKVGDFTFDDILDGIFSQEEMDAWRKEEKCEEEINQMFIATQPPHNQETVTIKKSYKGVSQKLTKHLKFAPVLFILYLNFEALIWSPTENLVLKLIYAMTFSTFVSPLLTKIGG